MVATRTACTLASLLAACSWLACSKANNPPHILSMTATPSSVPIGGSSVIAAVVQDEDGDTLAFQWSASGGSIAANSGTQATWRAPAAPASCTVRLAVSDPPGASDTSRVEIQVMANQPPSTLQLSGPTHGRQGDTLTYTLSATDPENQDVEYMVTWGDTTTAEWSGPYASGQAVARPHVFGDSGTYSVRFKARDTRLAESGWSDSLVVSVGSGTQLVGTLVLQNGQPGDVQDSRVQLYVTPDLSGDPVYEVSSRPNTPESSPFEFTNPDSGSYYLLAFKDRDGDGAVSDSDIVGVHGGTYRPGYGGLAINVVEDEMTDVGEVAMRVYKELEIAASGERVNGRTQTDFTYTFSYDVTLAELTITFPGYSPVVDPLAPGVKTAGTDYYSNGWEIGGDEMPTGEHTLRFVGTWEDGDFDISVAVDID